MSNISTFGTFTMARLGIYAAQKAIDITGNNIANINTEGYTRQTIDQFSLNMGGADRYASLMDSRIGSGVFVTGVAQVRDQYLDIRYRNEVSQVGYMDRKLAGLEDVASIIDEVADGDDGGGILEARFNEFITALEDLHTQGAGQDRFDTLARSAATALVDQFHSYSAQLKTLEENHALGLEQDLEDVNSILERIRDLNVNIRKIQVYGGNCLELKDERNLLIDELAEYMNIDVSYSMESVGEDLVVEKLQITTADNPNRLLVDGIYATELKFRELTDDEGNKFRDPTYQIDTGPLEDSHGRVKSYDEDIGGLIVDMRYAVEAAAGELYPYQDVEEANALAEAIGEQLGVKVEAVQLSGENIETMYGLQVKSNGNTEFPDGTFLRVREEYYHVGNADDADDADDEKKATQYDEKSTAEAVATFLNKNKVYKEKDSDNYKYIEVDGVVNEDRFLDEDAVKTDYVNRNVGDNVGYSYKAVKVKVDGDPDANPPTEDKEVWEVHRFEVFQGESQLGDTELRGKILAEREFLTEKGEYATDDDADIDPDAAVKRGIQYYQKSLDTLARTFAEVLNEANFDTAFYAYMNTECPDEVINEDNIAKLKADFKDKLENDYKVNDPDKFSKYANTLFSSDGFTNDTTGIDASNISIAADWDATVSRIQETANPQLGTTASDGLGHMLNLLLGKTNFGPEYDKESGEAEPEPFFRGTFQEMLTNHIMGTLGIDLSTTQTILENYETQADSLYVDRDAVMGVDLNDEAMNMMMYQKAYSAACKLMTTFNEMLDRLLNV